MISVRESSPDEGHTVGSMGGGNASLRQTVLYLISTCSLYYACIHSFSHNMCVGSCYDGEVKDGLRHGEGTFYSSSHGIHYSGQWFQGRRNGKVCLSVKQLLISSFNHFTVA